MSNCGCIVGTIGIPYSYEDLVGKPSINGKKITGDVALDAGDVLYDSDTTYDSGTVGAALKATGSGLEITVGGVKYPVDHLYYGSSSGVSGVFVVYDDGSSDGGSIFLPDGIGMNSVKHELEAAIDDKEDKTEIVIKTSSDTAVTLEESKFYVFPEMSTLTVTCSAIGGPYMFRFTSGATATAFTISGITMPDDFAVEANRVYEINIYDGYGLAASWAVNA